MRGARGFARWLLTVQDRSARGTIFRLTQQFPGAYSGQWDARRSNVLARTFRAAIAHWAQPGAGSGFLDRQGLEGRGLRPAMKRTPRGI